MQFSLFFFAADDGLAGQDKYRLLLEASKLADQMGFHAVWTPERHFKAFGGAYPNAALTSAAIAVLTTRIKIRTGSIVLPLHHPIRVAEDFAVVDNLSNGRVELACVSGWHPDDYVLAPEKFNDREQILAEAIGQVKQLWRGEPLTLKNGRGEQTTISTFPRPIQRELEVWRVCQRAESCRWAGANGVNILTSMLDSGDKQFEERIRAFRSAALSSGAAGKLALMMHTFVGPNAKDVAWPAYKRYLQVNMEFQKSAAKALGEELPDTRTQDLEYIYRAAFERLVKSRGLIGDVEHCRSRIEYLKNLGVDEIACLIDFGIDVDVTLDALKNLDRLRAACAN